MTRETKIGLLVGLAFIIVIGILLSDHFRGATEPPTAPLDTVGRNVRTATATPGANSNPPVVVVKPEVSPEHTLQQPREIDPPPSPVVPAIQTTAGASPSPSGANSVASSGSPSDSSQNNSAAPVTTSLPVTAHPAAGAIADVARANGEEIVGLTGGSINSPAAPVVPTGTRTYTAQPGDSLSKIAGKFLGSSGKSAQAAIVKLNPSLEENPNIIIVGHKYTIPAASNGSTAAATPKPMSSSPASVAAAPTARPADRAADNWYTVQVSDTLWRIATDQCGTPSAVTAIKELNHLTGNEIRPGQKLRLPGKQVASVN
jgi:LysM repeat protein